MGRPCGSGPSTDDAGTRREVEHARRRSWRRPPRSACPARAAGACSSRITASVPAPMRERHRSCLPGEHRLDDGPELRAAARRRRPRSRTASAAGSDEHRQRDAVHVAVADRLGQQLGDEAEPREPAAMQTRPETIAIALASATARCGSPPDSGSTTREDQGRERRVRAQHQDAARAEQRRRRAAERWSRRGRRCRGTPEASA